MTDQTTDRLSLREQLLHAVDFAYCQTLGYSTPEELLDAYDASRTPADQGALRDRIADVLADADGWRWVEDFDKTASPTYQGYLRQAEAALAAVEAALGDTLVPAARAEALAGIAAVLPTPADEVDADTVANRAAQVITAMGADIRELKHSRDRHRTAWHNARRRAAVLSAEVTRRAPLLGEYAKATAKAQQRAAAMERAMESTAADALKHLGCHRDLMAQCQRAERAEAEVQRLRAELESERDVSRRLVAQRQELAEERHAWQQRGDRAEAELRRVADETAATPCAECSHPKTTHGEGEDPVSPGQCSACPDDDSWHDYQPAAETRQDGAQPAPDSPYRRLLAALETEHARAQASASHAREEQVGLTAAGLASGFLHAAALAVREFEGPEAAQAYAQRATTGARQDGAWQPGLRERHRAAWAALTPEQQAARLAELDADDEAQP